MNRARAETELARLGFRIDWSCTGPAEGYWSGTIDATRRGKIDGDCRGEVVTGDNAADFYRNAVAFARQHGPPQQCTDPLCQFHEGEPIERK